MRFLAFYGGNGMRKISLSDGSIEELPFGNFTWSGAIDPSGRYIAAGYVDDDPGSFDVSQKIVAEAGTFVGTFDKSWDVSHNKSAESGNFDDSENRF